jgi:hypothetical protein
MVAFNIGYQLNGLILVNRNATIASLELKYDNISGLVIGLGVFSENINVI